MFGEVGSQLPKIARKQYGSKQHWHNQFREQVVNQIDESIFEPLFNKNMGAPNASISVLVGMMVIKEAFGWSDSQLFEQGRFNLLVRNALGLVNLNDDVPVESTYYLFRKRIYEHQKREGEDLMEKSFRQVTHDQIREFEVNGKQIRMDSKLLGSNIAFFSRFEIVHTTLCIFFKTLTRQEKSMLTSADKVLLKTLAIEEPQKTVYKSNREEITNRLQTLGAIIFKLVNTFTTNQTQEYQLLCRVFTDQFKIIDNQKVELRPKEEISSSSVQSPHDPDSAFRNKRDTKVKGYSVNVTETASDDSLNLITDVRVEKANVPDTSFVQPAIESTIEVTGQQVETVYADGAYQSPDNAEFCENIDMVFTGIQGAHSKYDLEMLTNGELIVTDKQTGERTQAVLCRKNKNSIEDRWKISTADGYKYFGQLAIRASEMKRQLKNRSHEELNKRNNVEATIFQLSYPLRNNKTKYRGHFKQKIWATCRCLWINLVRIANHNTRNAQIPSVSCLKPVFLGKYHCILGYFRSFFTQSRTFQKQWTSIYRLTTIFSLMISLPACL
ncbi:transposase [Patescibacteria group bacterium]|nr:transposase [Patescibacteria group bacterium]